MNIVFINAQVRHRYSGDSFTAKMVPVDWDDAGSNGNTQTQISKEDQTKEVHEKIKKLIFLYLVEKEMIPKDSEEKAYTIGLDLEHVFSYEELQKKADELLDPGADKIHNLIKPTLHPEVWNKIVLPDETQKCIIRTLGRLTHQKIFFDTWNIKSIMGKRGRGINFLFHGPSGTGKTFCGEIISEYLGIKAEVISVSNIEDKFVGNSEKAAARLFATLRGANKVLIIDEVDSFLTSRSEMRQHHQTKLVNQFLRELERHNGVVVMTTNRSARLDKAVQRRIDSIIEFPEPTEKEREKLWKIMVPKEMPVEINPKELARFKLNGGMIKNVVLAAADEALAKGYGGKEKEGEKIPIDIFIKIIQEEMREKDAIENGVDHA